jgi:alkylation response protein AidB-like acyl-CoA dehydrogenase
VDFSFSDEQDAVAGVATQIFTGQASTERVKEVERSDERFDRALWAQLAQANLLGICLPEDDGGSGLGITELCLVLEQQGRRVAPVPLLWSTVAALAVAEFGGAGLRAAWLPGVVGGDVVLTLGMAEPGGGDPLRPWLEATADGDGWRLTGDKPSVPFAHVASRILVTARVAGTPDVLLALVDPRGPGTTGRQAETTDRQLVTHLTFDSARVAAADVVAGPERGAAATRWVLERALTGLCALQLGVAQEALMLAAAYTSTRLQFGKPLSSFQSTAARAADAYIDIEAIRATMWQAAWRLDRGLDATMAVEVAKWWASEAGQRVVHATQHLHGGLGADIEYPVHRYFLWGKQIEDTLGGGSAHLARIGEALAGVHA